MRSITLILSLGALTLASGATASLGAGFDADQPNGRAMTDNDINAARAYSEGLGREMLKDELGLDLQNLRLQFDPSNFSLENVGSAGPARAAGSSGALGGGGASSPGNLAGPARSQGFSLSLDQSGDLLRLGRDVRDIPFGLKLQGTVPLLARLMDLQTQVWVPFSWRDELKASASVPLPGVGFGAAERLLEDLGLKDRWDLRSNYSTRLGVNQLDAGLGTQWATQFTGMMDLDYAYSQRYGQGLDETIHWLKLRKDF
jgi:hypothetical protein